MTSRDVANGPLQADLCIVGAGPVGIALALRSAANGLRVLLVEAGAARVAGGSDIGSQGGLGEIEATGRHHAGMAAISRSGLGGTSVLWGGRCVAFDDLDFEKRAHVGFSGWPIAHDEVSRHYPAALQFLNCAPAASDDTLETGQPVTARALERWSANPDLGRTHEKSIAASPNIQVVTRAMVVGIDLDDGGQRVRRLRVHLDGAERELRATRYVLAGGGLGNVRLMLQCQREWPLKFGGTDGPLGRFYQGHLTGHVAFVEFTDRKAEAVTAFRRDGRGGYLRNRFQITGETQRRNGLLNSVFWPEAFSVADPAHASGALSALYLATSGAGLYGRFANGRALRSRFAEGDLWARHLGNMRADPHLLRDLARSAWNFGSLRTRRLGILPNPARRYLFRYHAEQAPDPESRVRLGSAQDGALLPNLSIDYRIGARDAASVVRSHVIVGRWLADTGIGRLEYLFDEEALENAVLDQALDGYHQIGITRMSQGPHEGVVNTDCRVHDLDNLYVAGSSVFPTGGQANPTLPAVALALRLADHLSRSA
ncbi:GMC oxidoreductase [Aureimonas mangrovi]|uniref:GMC oxidoreductase n=1 Tax=Aureimonas mangrovi TaxID=2758041 RepID=UPI00163D88B9|nr:GMC family oxidoreductase [Aureimonas mangrovi]